MNELSRLGKQLMDKKNGQEEKWGDKPFLWKNKSSYYSKFNQIDAEKQCGNSDKIMPSLYACRGSRQGKTRPRAAELAEPIQWSEPIQRAEPLQQLEPLRLERTELSWRAELPRQLQKTPEEEVNMVGPKNDWYTFKENTVKRGQEQAKHFNAGRTKHHVDFWKSLTTDPNIIAMVTGTTLELQNEIVQIEKQPLSTLIK